GAAAGAVLPGVSVLQGAVIGAAVGGLAGAVWADRNNDGVVDGYVYNGQYYPGAPPGYTGTAAAPPPAPAPMNTMPSRAGERG
ncbi:MAG TPA: glycine zipper domain-containing protein, partial [Sphingomicrobium sp.]|nr:glycine zipper domain-containing protein [Sphingomicrobium sp.]